VTAVATHLTRRCNRVVHCETLALSVDPRSWDQGPGTKYLGPRT